MIKFVAALFAVFSLNACGAEALRIVNSPITAALTVTKPTECVAPCAVMFDATNTTATGIIYPIHEILYSWNFGDTNAGTWTTGAGSNNNKNVAFGPVTAHVYETPGVYTACATYFDGINTLQNACATITVVEWNDATHGPTMCFAPDHAPTGGVDGCPSGATGLQSSNFPDSVLTAQNVPYNARRILFKRGENYTADFNGDIQFNGPGIIGAYGTGAKPIITAQAGNVRFIQFIAAVSNWRVMDLEFNGNYPTRANSRVVAANGPAVVDFLIFNTTAYNVNTHLTLGVAAPEHTGIYVFKNDWRDTNGSGGNSIFYDGYKLAVIGNSFTNPTTAGEHNVRTQLCNICVISNNTISGPAVTKQNITLRGRAGVVVAATTTNGSNVLTSVAMPEYLHVGIRAVGTNIPTNSIVTAFDYDAQTITINNNATGSGAISLTLGAWTGIYTEKAIVRDNYIIASTDWPMSICPQNETNDERSRNIIIENNFTTSISGMSLAHRTCSSNVTIRNNVVSGNVAFTLAALSREPSQPIPDTAWIYNNTGFSTLGSGTFRILNFGTSAYTNATLKNNVAYGAGMTGDTFAGTSGAGFVESNNSSDSQIGGTNPLFIGPTNTPSGFAPGIGSYTINAGTNVPVWVDFFMQPRTGTYSMGAVNP